MFELYSYLGFYDWRWIKMANELTTEQVKRLAKAKELLEKKNWSQASVILENLYQTSADIEINHLLVEALYMDQQYKLAQQYADEYQASFLATLELYKLMVALMLQNHQFIFARQFALVSENSQWVAIAIDEIEQHEQSDLTNLAITVKLITQQFYHLGDENFNEQKRRFELGYQLPMAQYVMGAKFLLRDPFTNPVIRASILQVLQQLHFDETVKVYWLDEQEHEVNCQKLIPIDKNDRVIGVLDAFEQKLGQEDPIALQMLSQEFQLQMVFCYPFINSVVTDSDKWAALAIARFKNQTNDIPTTSKISNWQTKLAQLSEQLLQNSEK